MGSPEPVPSAAGGILGVDVGGTFTDAVLSLDGTVFTAKAPTTPRDQSEGVMTAIRVALDRACAEPGRIGHLAHGMTVATNALLESKTSPTALITTRGFADLVEIGRQDRASLYRLRASHPPPLVPVGNRIEVDERCGPTGVLVPLSEAEIDRVLDRLDDLEIESVAICLLHSYRFPEHEARLGRAVRKRFGERLHISLSHEVVGTFREYERAATTEIDAALSPLLGRYLGRLRERTRLEGLPEPEIMQSSGGLTSLGHAAGHAALTVLSGPAGGAAAATMISRLAAEPNLLCFDMGGTSCDVCVVEDGAVHETGSKRIAGRPLALPMVDIDTVGAGGGSIAWRDGGGALRVGPHSAGADPGPACYGRGTDPTVTDANLLLRRLDPETPLSGGVKLDPGRAADAINALAAELGLTAEGCAEGIIRVANAEMVRALRVASVQRGLDPRRFTLLAFGGAGPLHATGIADELGIDRILVPRTGGVFSALGLAAADRRVDTVRSVLLAGDDLDDETLAELAGDTDEVSWDLRYRGQSFELTVSDPEPGNRPRAGRLRELFEAEHEARYGYTDPGTEMELVTVRRRRIEPGPGFTPGASADELHRGPATIDLGEATLYLPNGWEARAEPGNLLRLDRC
ncbi:MAG: hydantoinase/oxoprolinase family protein [Solirubrobacterales bacterium]|nr:hydantoinase/oxoprolinase family protein [Solirubrobacterales bacterium]